jgi:hypothetical protein
MGRPNAMRHPHRMPGTGDMPGPVNVRLPNMTGTNTMRWTSREGVVRRHGEKRGNRNECGREMFVHHASLN